MDYLFGELIWKGPKIFGEVVSRLLRRQPLHVPRLCFVHLALSKDSDASLMAFI